MAGYNHGVYVYEVPTSILPPRRMSAGVPVVIGTAPAGAPINDPKLIYSYKEFVDTFGWDDDIEKYTLCEFAKVFFALYNVAPAIFINVFDPDVHVDAEGNPDPTVVDGDDIIGGIDATTGKKEGLELVNDVFPKYRLVPGFIVSPGFSKDSAVAIVMSAKAESINGHFKAMAVVDIDVEAVKKYSDAPGYKNDNNLTDELMIVCWPKVKLGDEVHWMSSHVCGLAARVDAEHMDIPYKSPSNERLNINGACLKQATEEVFLGLEEANYLNGNGIVTTLNFIGGWKLWGNRTGAYPAVTDPKDAFVPIRRMFNWIGNELVLTFWQKVDAPIRKRLIDTIVDSYNIRLNGLVGLEAILGGRVEFVEDENPLTDLIDGIVRFHVYVTPPTPAREIDFMVEFDPKYFETLFG